MWIFNIEASELEHILCKSSHDELHVPIQDYGRPTILRFALICELICLTERVHEVGQTSTIQMRRVIRQ
jgi:hypothetical protein